jgi:hypothetical protein
MIPNLLKVKHDTMLDLLRVKACNDVKFVKGVAMVWVKFKFDKKINK